MRSLRSRGRQSGRVRLAALGPTAIMSATIVVAAVAVAAPVFAFASRSTHGFVVPKFMFGSASTTCPKGEHVGFGGVVTEFRTPRYTLTPGGQFANTPLLGIDAMRWTAPGEWTVSAQSATLSGSRLTSIAYCDPGSDHRQKVTSTVAAAGSVAPTAVASCPAGKVVVAGGFATSWRGAAEHGGQVARLERTSSSQWTATFLNLTQSLKSLTAIAYCGTGAAPVPRERSVTLAHHKGGTARVGCPAGTKLVFGGMRSTIDSLGVGAPPFSLSAPSTVQWEVAGYNWSASPSKLVAIAYCR